MPPAKRSKVDAAAADGADALARAASKFIDSTPTPFHMCSEAGAFLEAAGFTELSEKEDGWRKLLKPGSSYYYVRNGSTLVAFTVGAAYKAGNGFRVVGAHTDSPVLKLKPCSKKSAHGYLQLSVETYGGGLWHTWFDRELTLAGACIVKEGATFKKKLVHVRRPILRVPSLCIHLQQPEERAKFAPNKETHLQPVFALICDQLNKPTPPSAPSAKDDELDERHSPELLTLLAGELHCAPSDILDFELTLCDAQPSQIWGLHNEFLSSPRLDNQIHCFTALRALAEHAKTMGSAQDDIALIALFDHEEVGSESYCGAGSTVMGDAMARLSACFAPDEAQAASECLMVTTRKSFLISADVAHAVHPNYSEKHHASHAPKLNGGTVIKTNDNQRYATNAESGFILRELARRAGTAVQEFMVKNDCPCGTTIGPIIASRTGLRTVDVGVPSLSMHSIRETVGTKDVDNSYQLFRTFFTTFGELDNACDFRCVTCDPQ